MEKWREIQLHVRSTAQEFSHDVHSLVMMDTHIHVISSTVKVNENFFSQDLQKKIGNSDADGFSEPIDSYAQFLNAYKYVYRNPVEAKLCRRCEDYAYSSLQGLLGRQRPELFVVDLLGLVQNPIYVLSWLNGINRFKASDHFRATQTMI